MRIREESRTSTAVIDPTSGEQTEINEHGPLVSDAELEHFVEKLLYLAQGAPSASSPAACRAAWTPASTAGSSRSSSDSACSTVLDSEGEPLRVGTRKGPDLVSPNELEAEELVGHEFADEEDRLAGIARDRRAGRRARRS